MTRRSKREIERAVDDMADGPSRELGRPFAPEERDRLAEAGVDVDAWGATQQTRAIFRGLQRAAREARS